MPQSLRHISWPVAAVLMTSLIVLGATALAGPSVGLDGETLRWVLGSEGGVFVLLVSFLKPIIRNAAALGLALLVASSTLTASACSPTEIQVHAEVAQALYDVARETRELVRRIRTDRGRTAARAVFEAGGTQDEAVAAATAAKAELAPLVEAQRNYAMAAATYVSMLNLGLHTAEGGAQGAIGSALPALQDVADAYRHLRRLGVALDVPEFAAMPEIPPWLEGILPPRLLSQVFSPSGVTL